ncbi:MAG: sigma-54-dependent transcriptional regulator [Thermodesulfobacteriota bacterium]
MYNKQPDLQSFSFLLFENDPSSLHTIEYGLKGFGAQVYTAKKYEDAMSILSRVRIHVIVASLNLVDEKCITMIKDYKSLYPDSLFYLLLEEDYDSVETSMDSVRFVVDDYIRKPLDLIRFAMMVETTIGRPGTESTSLSLINPLIKKVKPYFLFRSPVMQHVLSNLPEISVSDQPVLISGETGTGKEIVARAVHVLSKRANGPFIPVNCGAIPESLIEGELFGHEKGAFTGAIKTRKGKFESADKGTLFLDEIGDMPVNLQVRLLRVLEEGKVYRVGGETHIPVNVRIIAATRIDIEKAVSNRLFREDLYYRLNVLRINLPPLRERVEDISLLSLYFLERAFGEMGRTPPYPTISSETIYLLEHHPWKGNIRELRNIMTRIATLLPIDTRQIFPFHILPHLKDEIKPYIQPTPAKDTTGIYIPVDTKLRQVEDLLIKETLRHTNGNRTKAAYLLGISLRTLRRKLNKTTIS